MIRFLIGFFVGFPFVASAAIKLTPQDVADRVLSKSRQAKVEELTAQKSYITLQNSLGTYDLKFSFTPSYEMNEAENLQLMGNLRERTQTILASISKQFRTGTNLAFEFTNIQQSAVLRPNSPGMPNITLNSAQVTLRQSIWQNAFGYADRLAEEIGRGTVEAAIETRDQKLQTVLLEALKLYWNTYVAERQLKDNIAAREKYELLIQNVRRKAGFNLQAPGELPRLQAELQGVEQKVKRASANYLNSLQELLTFLQLETSEPVEIAAPMEIPPIPKLAEKNIDSLRAVRIAEKNLENARKTLLQTKNRNHPKLDLVLKAKATGVDNEAGTSFAEMQAATKPYYYIGLQFETPFWGSERKRGEIANAEVGLQLAEVEYLMKKEEARNKLAAKEREVASLHAIAKAAVETVQYRERVVRDLDRAYNQGRQSLVELIRAYNELFAAQQERADAIGKYHIALNELAAARDELVATIQSRKER